MTDPLDLLLDNLRGKVPVSSEYMTRERAYEALKLLSGEDWGYDADAWARRRDHIHQRMQPAAESADPQARAARLRRALGKLRDRSLATDQEKSCP
jgi:hypothetical protein